MTCSRGTWDDIAVRPRTPSSLQWLRDSVAIDGKTGSTYDVVAADTGHSISCTARAENLTNASPVNGAETVRAPENKVVPRITGNPRLRQTLVLHAAATGTTRPSDRYAVSYRWLRDGTEIPGATQRHLHDRPRRRADEPLLPRPRRGPDQRDVGERSTSAGPTT